MTTAKQFHLEKCGGRREDQHPRAHLYAIMALLAAQEDECLTALEAYDEWDDGPEDEYTALENDLDLLVDRANNFYALVIGPLYRSWWIA